MLDGDNGAFSRTALKKRGPGLTPSPCKEWEQRHGQYLGVLGTRATSPREEWASDRGTLPGSTFLFLVSLSRKERSSVQNVMLGAREKRRDHQDADGQNKLQAAGIITSTSLEMPAITAGTES